jgi:tripeptidyl-peptidase I
VLAGEGRSHGHCARTSPRAINHIAAVAMSVLFKSILASAAFAVLAASAPTTSSQRFAYRVHEMRTSASRDWVKRDRIESSAIIPVRIGLTQTNLGLGDDLLMQV